jgi:hypothetical protein
MYAVCRASTKFYKSIFGTSSCFEFWWFELMVINVVFGPVELMMGL